MKKKSFQKNNGENHPKRIIKKKLSLRVEIRINSIDYQISNQLLKIENQN